MVDVKPWGGNWLGPPDLGDKGGRKFGVARGRDG